MKIGNTCRHVRGLPAGIALRVIGPPISPVHAAVTAKPLPAIPGSPRPAQEQYLSQTT
ncbi:hypothetical protein M8494_27410 [Serratia ureilytica]